MADRRYGSACGCELCERSKTVAAASTALDGVSEVEVSVVTDQRIRRL